MTEKEQLILVILQDMEDMSLEELEQFRKESLIELSGRETYEKIAQFVNVVTDLAIKKELKRQVI